MSSSKVPATTKTKTRWYNLKSSTPSTPKVPSTATTKTSSLTPSSPSNIPPTASSKTSWSNLSHPTPSSSKALTTSSSTIPTTAPTKNTFSNLAPPRSTPPQTPLRTYKISSASSWSRRFAITTTNSTPNTPYNTTETILYNLTFTSSIKDFSMILHTGPPKSSNPTIVAATKVSLYKNTTVLSLGDSNSNSSTKLIDMTLNSIRKHNSYDLPFPLPTGQTLPLQWKGTQEVSGFMAKMDVGMHHKLVETVTPGFTIVDGVRCGGPSSSGRLLARYVHDSWSMDVPGIVEIMAVPEGVTDVGEWDLFVLLGALAVAEKTLKNVNMAIGAA